MKQFKVIELYINSVTVINADKWTLEEDPNGKITKRLCFYRNGRIVAMFNMNNIAGVMEV